MRFHSPGGHAIDCYCTFRDNLRVCRSHTEGGKRFESKSSLSMSGKRIPRLASARLPLWKPAAIVAGALLALLLGPPRLNQRALRADAGYSKRKPGCEPILPSALRPLIEKTAAREGLEPALLWTVIRRESGFRPCAVSRTGARGLMQLMPATAAELGVRNSFDPEQNLAGGARFLAKLMRRYQGDERLALAAYHIGPGAVDNLKGRKFGPAARRYVSAILQMRDRFRRSSI